MDRAVRTRDRAVNQIKAIREYCETINNATTLAALQTREDQLERRYKDFSDYEVDLLQYDNYDQITTQVDEIYLNTMAILKAEIDSRTQENHAEVTNLNETLGQFIGQQQTFLQGMHQTSNVRLPKVNIEPFAGDYKLWPSFQDLYITSVHENNALSSVHKLQILNGLLRGEAAALIRHIKGTEQNYTEAWNKLVARYNKPKSVIFSLIQLFLDQKSCNLTNHRELRRLCDISDEVIRGLRALGEEAELRDPWLIHMLVNKVDSDTRQLWAKESVEETFPTFHQFLKFLNTRCDALESCMMASKPSTSLKNAKSFHIHQPKTVTCVACKMDHFLYRCPVFKSMDCERRIKLVENSNSCTNCLRQGHLQSQCFSRALCLICKKRHHSLLHKELPSTNLHLVTDRQDIVNNNSTPSISTAIAQGSLQSTNNENLQSTSSPQHSSTTYTTTLHDYQPSLQTLLPTALIYIQSSNGQQLLARALLDSGSQSTFISESCVQRLGLRRKYAQISIYGLASCSAGKTRGKTTFTIKSRVSPHYTKSMTALIIEKISSSLPDTLIPIPDDNELWKLELADPYFNKPNAIDLLIGAEHFLEILSEQKLTIPKLPVLHASQFGWLIAGTIKKAKEGRNQLQNFSINLESRITNEQLMESLKKFWKVEEPSTRAIPPEAKDPCELLYETTTTRSPDGRFIVRLPFKTAPPELGESISNAKARLNAIERKFMRSVEYHKDYQQFIEEYIQLDQMIRVPWSEIPPASNQKYFMPHHTIYKESTTTKLRVVFDASCKTSNGLSLNDCLYVGPKIQPELVTTLLRFRQYKIAINADIEKMYRQILVDPSDAIYQHILWRNSPQEEMCPYKCMTVTYGTACAPFLAVRSLEELARINKTDYPEASQAISNHFYMDDLLTGSTTEDGAIKLKDDIIKIFNSGGFKLRKWKSNSSEFLQSLTSDNQEEIPKLIEDDPSTKTLGIMWYPQSDIFTFKINSQIEEVQWTKRKMLSESSRLYDPLGWLSPVIIQFKLILQKLWLTKTDWDEIAPNHLLSLWNKIYYNLPYLQQIQIPRCLFQSAEPTTKQLHAFCDASELAYGCVVYMLSRNTEGDTTCHIVYSKSKVAPLKKISLPRLELCGAVLLAELINYCKGVFNIDSTNIYGYTDSMVVLHWLSDIPARCCWKIGGMDLAGYSGANQNGQKAKLQVPQTM